MKKQILLAMLVIWAVPLARAALFTTGMVNGNSDPSLNVAIPDANPSGVTSTLQVSGLAAPVSSLTVTLNVSGGYNGDLYSYLVAPDGTMSVLLNRVGIGSGNPIQSYFGYSTAGFYDVTLSDTGMGGSIHDVPNPGSLPTAAYMPDGGSLASFNGVNANGTWTLFFADQAGGNMSTLNGWSLNITMVPEPVAPAMGIFAVLLLLLGFSQRLSFRRPPHWINLKSRARQAARSHHETGVAGSILITRQPFGTNENK